MKQIERIKNMSKHELAMFLMKVNCAYDMPCMFGVEECKHSNKENCCAICFEEYLDSEVPEAPTRKENA